MMSAALAANSGSVLMHQLRRRRRLMPWRRSVRQTWSALDVAQVAREERAGPRRVAPGGGVVERREDPRARSSRRSARPGTWARCVGEAGQPITGEPRPPLGAPGPGESQPPGDLVGARALGGGQDDPGPLHHRCSLVPARSQDRERLLLSLRQHDGGRGLPHPRMVQHDALLTPVSTSRDRRQPSRTPAIHSSWPCPTTGADKNGCSHAPPPDLGVASVPEPRCRAARSQRPNASLGASASPGVVEDVTGPFNVAGFVAPIAMDR